MDIAHHEITTDKAWEIYSKGIRPDSSPEEKEAYVTAIHRLRQATKEGYSLVKTDDLLLYLSGKETITIEDVRTALEAIKE